MTNERRRGDAETSARYQELLKDMANIALYRALIELQRPTKERPDDGSGDQGPPKRGVV